MSGQDNPHWDYDTNEAIPIVEKGVWEEAEASGWITPQHLELRLRNKIMNALGIDDGFMAYDEEGFARALIAEGIRSDGGVTLHVYADDHDPPHAHIKLSKDPKVNLKIDLETGEELKGSRSGRLKQKEIQKIQQLVLGTHAEELAELWDKNGPDRKN